MFSTNPPDNICAEATRYALLRRLVPAMLHNMAGALQPIGMTAAIMEKRLQTATPDLLSLIKSGGNIKTLSREASTTFMDLMTWLAPKGTPRVAVNAGIEDTLGMVSTELAFRGFTVVNETANICAEVPQNILRSVYLAGLMAVTDAAQSSGQVALRARAAADEILLEIEFTAIGNESVLGGLQTYRKIDWDDVRFLARAEGVGIEHTGNKVTMRIDNRAVTAPSPNRSSL